MTGPSTIAPEDTGSYTITVTNNGPDDAQNVVLTVSDVIDLEEFSISPSNAAAQNATAGFVGIPPLLVANTETLPTLAAGAQATFSLQMEPASSAPAGTDLSEDLSVTSDTPDPDSTNNADMFPITVGAPVADLAVTMTGPSSAAPGDVMTYHITLTNNGPSDAADFFASGAVPIGLTPVSFTQTSGPTSTSLPAGATVTYEAVYTVDNDTALGTVLSFTFNLGSMDTSDPDSSNNSATVNTTVRTPQADLAVAMTGPSTANAGDQVSYDITVTNNGPTSAQGVNVTPTVPTDTTLVSFNQTAGPTAGVALPPGGTETFVVVVQTDGSAADGTVLTNMVQVSTTTPDPNNTNNSASVDTTLSAKADLTVNMTGSDNINAGENQTYDITVTNNGPSDAQNYMFSYSVSTQGVTSVSLVQDSGPSNGETLAAGSTAFYELSVLTDPMAPDMTTVNVLAQVTSDTTDPDISNNNTGLPVTLNAP